MDLNAPAGEVDGLSVATSSHGADGEDGEPETPAARATENEQVR